MEEIRHQQFHTSREQWAAAFGISAATAAILTPVVAQVSGWAAGAMAILCFMPLPWFAAQMPETLRGATRRRPVLSVAWVVLTLLALVQMGRLSAFMVDSSRLWGSTVPDPIAANHQCMAAYVHAADLCRRGKTNVYDERWYPAFTAPLYTEPRGVSSPVAGSDCGCRIPTSIPRPFSCSREPRSQSRTHSSTFERGGSSSNPCA